LKKKFIKNFCFLDKILVQKIIFEFFADFCSAYKKRKNIDMRE